jgi:hypothetical protein
VTIEHNADVETQHTPTTADVDRIAALPDPVIRNLQITQAYHELAAAMAARVSGANWCTFATWASKQAGQTIRREDLARLVDDVARRAPIHAVLLEGVVASILALGSERSAGDMEDFVWDLVNPVAALDRASDAVARGNRKVFEEIGREFARFITACIDDGQDPARIARFCADLRPGDPPDGQQYLRQAFTRYHEAFFEPDAARRAQLQLLANIEIGFHEQTRLQPEIAEAMNAALVDPREFRERAIKALFPVNTRLVRVRLFLLKLAGRPRPVDLVIDVLLAESRRLAHLVITECLMTIGLPHGVVLRLGDDVPGDVPADLRQVTLPDLLAMIARFDPTPETARGSGAIDWSSLPDRLHYIVDLFLRYHEVADLLEPPFTAEQEASLRAGQLPPGSL